MYIKLKMNITIKTINHFFSNCSNYVQEYKIGQSTRYAPHLKEYITKLIPSAIREFISNNNFIVKGSIGLGAISDTLWIAVINKSVTQSIQKGVYIMFLFSKDLRHVYITLFQSAIEIRSTSIGPLNPRDRTELLTKVSKIREKLGKIVPRKYLYILTDPFILNVSKKSDYGCGCIFANEWSVTEDTEKLAKLFNIYLDIYDIYYKNVFVSENIQEIEHEQEVYAKKNYKNPITEVKKKKDEQNYSDSSPSILFKYGTRYKIVITKDYKILDLTDGGKEIRLSDQDRTFYLFILRHDHGIKDKELKRYLPELTYIYIKTRRNRKKDPIIVNSSTTNSRQKNSVMNRIRTAFKHHNNEKIKVDGKKNPINPYTVEKIHQILDINIPREKCIWECNDIKDIKIKMTDSTRNDYITQAWDILKRLQDPTFDEKDLPKTRPESPRN